MVIGAGMLISLSLVTSVNAYVVCPLVMMIFVLVVRVIIHFKIWYVREKKFELLLVTFSLLIALYFVICRLGLVLR